MNSVKSVLNTLADMIQEHDFDSKTSAHLIRICVSVIEDAERGLVEQSPVGFTRALLAKVNELRAANQKIGSA